MSVCEVNACDRIVLVKNLCRKHYQQKRKHGNVNPVENIYERCDGFIKLIIHDVHGNYKGETIFNEEHLLRVKQLKWIIKGGYVRNTQIGFFHNFLLSSKEKIDHVDRNKLNNLDENLRVCTFQENNRNKSKHKNNQSGFIGVSWRKDANKWRANITVDYKNKSLGSFTTMEEAIIARLVAEKKYFGEFAPQKQLFAQYRIE